jgi:VIT1/CCC1 family predicted Fe2+/Mn2+ transporter
MDIDGKIKKEFIRFQRNEITESLVYSRLASIEKDNSNKKILLNIAADEVAHGKVFQKYTKESPIPNRWKIFKYYWLARFFGLTFALKLMESSESNAHKNYDRYASFPELLRLGREEEEHEKKLIGLINEERLEYMGSVVLG